MSQSGILRIASGILPPAVPTSFVTNSGIAVPALNILNVLGTTVAAGIIPFQFTGSGNTVTGQIQRTQALAAADSTKIGLANFDSSSFAVDANGFVTLLGGGEAIDSVAVQTGTSPVVPTAAGLITINGATVVAGSNPVRTDGTGPNTLAVEVQISQALASTDATKIGLANFNSAHFSVDGNGFVSLTGAGFKWNDVSGAFAALKENGYFITGTATGTLPGVPVQGDTIEFFVDHSSQVLTIQASGTQIIRMGSLVSSAGGTWISTLQGDSCELVYRASDNCWCAVDFVGTWTKT